MITQFKLTDLIKNTVRIGSLALGGPKPSLNLSDIQRVLVISLTHLGDMMTLTPFFKSLREELPEAEIHVLVKDQVKAVIERCPYIDRILIYNAYWVVQRGKKADKLLPTAKTLRYLRAVNYDAAIVTHEHIFSSMMAYLAGVPIRIGFPQRNSFLNVPVRRDASSKPASEYPLDILKYIGFKAVYHRKEFWITDDEMAEARRIVQGLRGNDEGSVFVLHPGAGGVQKILPTRVYAIVMEHIITRYAAPVILMGGPSETSLAQEIIGMTSEYARSSILNLAGKTTIGSMAAIMSQSNVIVTNDNGPMHIADSVNRPVISLFTTSSPEIWRPINHPLSKVVYHSRRADFPVKPILNAIDHVVGQSQLGEESQREAEYV